MLNSETLAQRYNAASTANEQARIQHQINHQVSLLAVSKGHPADRIKELYELGARQFGENYVQEGVEKVKALADLDIEWHFIGHLQSNKSQLIAEHFDWLQTLTSIKLARRLNKQREKVGKPLNVCIQINIDQEETKSGIHPNDLLPLANQIIDLPYLRLRGLMAIPNPSSEESTLTESFKAMQQLQRQLSEQLQEQTTAPIDTLSMGMSKDYELAISCGATMIRIGTALFGPRARPAPNNE